MKHTKKLLLAMLCIILALTSVLLVVAACNGEETGFKVTVADCEHGTVSVSDPAEGELYDDGESVTVTVTPATDYEVASFKVNGADVELVNGTTYTFNISQDTTIAATFSQIVPETGFSVTVSDYDKAQGSVEVSAPAEGTLYDEGETVTVTVTPAADHRVDSFKVNDEDEWLLQHEYTFEIGEDTTIAVTFKHAGFSVTVDEYDDEQGSVEVSAPADGGKLYNDGESVTVTVTPVADHAVDTFKVNGKNVKLVGNVYTFEVDENTSIAVTFKVVGFTVNVNDFDKAQGSVEVSAPIEGELYYNEAVTVTVTPVAGHEVKSFKVNDVEVALVEGVYTFNISANTTIAVVFDVEHFDVTFNMSHENGGVVTFDPEKPEGYLKGEVAKFSIAPGYCLGLESVYVGEDKLTADADGKYSVTVNDDVTVDVTFNVLNADKVLDSLDGSLKLEGTMVNGDDEEPTYTFHTIFDETNNYVLLQRYDGKTLGTHLLLKNVSGKPALVYHGINGQVQTDVENADWNDFWNPFYYIDSKDLVPLREGVWTVANSDIARSIADAVIGLGADIDTLEIYVNEQFVANRLVIVFAQFSDSGMDLQYNFDFTISENGTAVVPAEYYTNYELTDGHAKLKSALEKAAQATSYKVRYQGTEEGYGTNEYNVYYTSDGIYEDLEGWEQGWFTRADGNVWEFHYEKGESDAKKLVIDKLLSTDGLDYFKAMFTLVYQKNDLYILLKDNGDNSFEVRPEDESNLGVSGLFGQILATGRVELELFSYAYSFKVVLNENGDLYQVILDYNDYVDEHVVLTFSDWNATTLPENVKTDLAAVKAGKIDAKYVGEWVNEDGKYTLDVTLEGLKFNGAAVAADKITATADKVDFVVGEDSYSIVAGDNGRIVLSGGKLEANVELAKCTWADFIGEFVGKIYENQEDKVGKDVKIVITGFEVKVGFNDAEPTAVSITQAEYLYLSDEDGYTSYLFRFKFTIGADAYVMEQYEEDNADMFLFVKDTGGKLLGYPVYRDRYVELTDWTSYYGEFEGEGYNIVIGADGITITKGEDVVTIAKDDVLAFTDYDYDVETYFTQFRFTYKDKEALIQPDGDGLRYVLFVADRSVENYEILQILSVDFEMDWSYYVGAWSGSATSGDEYIVEITEDAVYITVNGGDPQEATVVFFEADSRGVYFTLKFNGGNLYMTLYPSFGFGSLNNADRTFSVSLEEVIFYTDYYEGIFTSRDGKYEVVIGRENIVVTIDDGDPKTVPAEDVYFYVAQNGAYTFMFSIDGTSYYLQQKGITDEKLVFTDDRNFQVVVFAEDYTFDVSDFVGTFAAEDESGSYSVVVTEDGEVTLTINGNEYEGTDVDVTEWFDAYYYEIFYELSFVANGEEYFFQVNGDVAYLFNGEDEDSEDYFEVMLQVPALTYESFIGEYEGDPEEESDYGMPHITLTITAEGLVLTVGEASYNVAVDDVTFAHTQMEDYGETYDIYQFEFVIDEVTWSIMSYDNTYLVVMNDAEDDTYIEAALYNKEFLGDDDEPITWDEKFEGTYSVVVNGVVYTLEIKSDGLYLTIGEDGATVYGDVLKFDSEEGTFTVVFDDVRYTITNRSGQDEVSKLFVFDVHGDFIATFNREIPSLGVPEGYIGTWTGTNDLDNEVVLVISDTEITISFDGDDAAVTFIYVDADGAYINIKAETFDYTITITESGLHLECEFPPARSADLTKSA